MTTEVADAGQGGGWHVAAMVADGKVVVVGAVWVWGTGGLGLGMLLASPAPLYRRPGPLGPAGPSLGQVGGNSGSYPNSSPSFQT
jgi:hypothetical protein